MVSLSNTFFTTLDLLIWFLYNSLIAKTAFFLPVRRYASAGNSDRNVSVCLSERGLKEGCGGKIQRFSSFKR